MEKVINQIKAFFDEGSWKYKYYEDKKAFKTIVSMGNSLGDLKIYILLKKDSYITYAILNNKASQKSFADVSEFINRANYGLLNGNFELDYSDGEVRYKSFVDFTKASISKEIIFNSIAIPIFMIDQYGEDLLKVMLGEETPEEGIKNAESKAK